jgi:spore coat protein U-like protein
MKRKSRKTGYIILVFSLLLAWLASTAYALPVTMTPASGTTLTTADRGTAYTSNTLTAGGAAANPYTWSATGLPAGLALTPSGWPSTTCRITGTPTVSGSFTINVTVRDANNNSVTNTYYLTVYPPLTLTPGSGTRTTIAPSAVRNVMYTSSTIFVAGGGSGTYTWSTPTALPAGLTLSSTSGNNIQVTGTCTATTGNKNFTVRVTDSTGSYIQWTYRVVVINTGCDFAGGDNTAFMSFGNVDPTAGAGTIYGTETSDVQFACSSPTAVTITVAPASGWQITSGSNTMSYALVVAPSGTYGNLLNDLFIANSTNITQGQYINAPAGTYTNTSAITVTIAWAGGTVSASLPIGNVNATIQNGCAVTGSPALAFGNLNAITNASGATATVTPPSIMCTMTDAVTVTNDGGLNYSGTPRLKSGTDYINYNFSSAGSLTGAGGTTDIGGSGAGKLNIGATMNAGALDNAPAGTYNVTITLTISY